MKICLINNLYKPFSRGGAEKVTSTIAEGFLSAGHEVFLITTRPRFLKFKPSPDDVPAYYLKSFYYHLNRLPKIFRFFWLIYDMFDFFSYFKIKKILRKNNCDLVMTNNLMGLGYLTVRAIKKLKIKHIHLVHDIQLIHPSGFICYGRENIIESYYARIYAGLASYLVDSPPVVIFPSYWLRDRYLDKIFFIKSKRIVLPNPIALGPEGDRQAAGENFKFLYLGQIEKHKGLDLLIQAYKKAKATMPSAELIIAGDGSELKRLKKENQSLTGLKFVGRQNEPEVKNFLQTCQALVVPTICYENCPAVISEAFVAGLPVIAADLGGITELIGEKAGLLFRPTNADDLANKMIWLAQNPSEMAEIIKAGRQKAAGLHVEKYLKELRKLINF